MELLSTRTSPHNFGRVGLSKYADVGIFYGKYFTKVNIEDVKIIFCKIDDVKYFIDKLLPMFQNKFNLIIGDGDITFPKNIDVRYKPLNIDIDKLINNEFVHKVFVENLDSSLPKTFPIPLGINPAECPTDLNYFLNYENIDTNKDLKITNFNRTRDGTGQWKERGDVSKLCETSWKPFVAYIETTNHKKYLEKMGRYSFTLCVHGGGLDVNPKLFEALLIGVIPIIKENKPYTDIYTEHNFPVVIVKEWNDSTINENNLKMWHSKYYCHFTNKSKRTEMLNKLSLKFWVDYVSNID